MLTWNKLQLSNTLFGSFVVARSRHMVSQEKTLVYFSKNVSRLLKKDICDVMGFQYTKDLGKYMGVPILHKRVGFNPFNYVVDKIKQRFSTSKSRTLLFVGRVTLAKSVVQAMPTYMWCNLLFFLKALVMKLTSYAETSFGLMR